MREQILISWKEHQLAAVIDYPKNMQLGKKYPLLIICHGFIGSKVGVDRLFVKTANALTKEELIVLRFDYSGCGESSGDYGITGLHNLIDQTRTVIEFGFNLKQVDQKDITLLGHSLGGATAALTAAIEQRINRLILWSAVAHPYEDIRRIVGIEKVRSLKKVPSIDYLGYDLTRTFFDALSKYEPLQSAAQFSGDVLLIHGSGDEEIPVSYLKDYEKVFTERVSGECEIHEIHDANHTFSNSIHFNEVIAHTVNWLRKQKILMEYHAKKQALIG